MNHIQNYFLINSELNSIESDQTHSKLEELKDDGDGVNIEDDLIKGLMDI